MAESQFTWVKTHKDIVDWLKVRKDNQKEIVALIIDLGIKGIEDQDEEGNRIPLQEIDPFTFFSSVYKYSKKGTILLQEIAKRINSYPLPTDVLGLPTANPVNARLFPYKPNRTHNEINRLWDFFYKALDDSIDNEDFNDILKIENIAIVKITEVLFYVNPEKYLCINGPTKPYIKEVLEISPEFETYSEYMNILNRIKAKTSDPFYKISYDAWLYLANLSNYWLFQGNPKVFDIVGALNSNTIEKWTVSAHKDKIRVGDKVILWMSGEKRGCYGLAEISTEPNKRKNLEKDDDYWVNDTKKIMGLKAGIRILHNLANKPILWDSIKDHPILKNLAVGLQGTNFKATKAQYESLEKLITQGKSQDEYVIDEKYTDDKEGVMKKPLNLILYGPPGTGKTYNTVNKALEILGIESKGKTRAEIKELFNDKMKDGQIVFTTFHQSMSYEDFIEGIKPLKPKSENESVLYDIQDGIFKTLCKYASKNSHKIMPSSEPQSTFISSIKEDDFRKLYNDYVMKLPDSSQSHSDETFETKTGKKEALYRNSNNAIVIRPQSSNQDMILTYERFRRAYFDKAELDHTYIPLILKRILEGISHNFEVAYTRLIDYLKDLGDKVMKIKTPNGTEFGISINSKGNLNVHTAPEFKLSVTLTKENLKAHAFNETVPKYDMGYFHGVINLLKTRYGYGENTKGIQNFVLIIDEINRGNVAQIFGELITLIEEDKRLGNPEALEVTLPYSKEKFGVPPNLYIIGTMNTADRSIEALDTALRRRFCFEEITPRYDLVELQTNIAGFKLHELLRKINDRIEKLIDKDHMIGHSYFMSVNDINDLKAVFQNKVNPLLQEYFFGDFGKIGLVLGAGFFEHEGKPDNESQVRFASFNDYDDEELSNHPVYRLKNVVLMNDTEFTEAIATLMR